MRLIECYRRYGIASAKNEIKRNLEVNRWDRWEYSYLNNSYQTAKTRYQSLGTVIAHQIKISDGYSLLDGLNMKLRGLRHSTDWNEFFNTHFNIDASSCDACGRYCDRDNMHSLEHNDLICENCTSDYYWNDDAGCYQSDPVEDEEDADGCILGRHQSKRLLGYIPTSYEKRKPQVYLGLELEMEVNRDSYRTDKAQELLDAIKNAKGIDNKFYRYASTEDDGSLNYGFEMVTAYTGLDIHKEQLKFFKKRFTDVKSHNTSSCGLHVHICKSDMTMLHASKLVFFINDDNNTKLIHAIARRSDWWACKLHPSKTKDLSYIKDTLRNYNSKSNQLKYLNTDRYEALNFQNANTVEFRIFRGTLVYETIMACLEFTYASWFFTRNASIEQLNIPNFIDFICKAENRPDTQFLRPYLFNKGFSSFKQLQPKQKKEIA
jgi:hypothetical protein